MPHDDDHWYAELYFGRFYPAHMPEQLHSPSVNAEQARHAPPLCTIILLPDLQISTKVENSRRDIMVVD